MPFGAETRTIEREKKLNVVQPSIYSRWPIDSLISKMTWNGEVKNNNMNIDNNVAEPHRRCVQLRDLFHSLILNSLRARFSHSSDNRYNYLWLGKKNNSKWQEQWNHTRLTNRTKGKNKIRLKKRNWSIWFSGESRTYSVGALTLLFSSWISWERDAKWKERV